METARLYGRDENDGVGGDGAFFLLLDEPEVYGLPPDPIVTTRDLPAMWKAAGGRGDDRRGRRPASLGSRRRCMTGGIATPGAGWRRADGGPATQKRRSKRRRRGGRRAAARSRWSTTSSSRSYYGRPIIKAPVWKSPDVPLYLFLGGAAGDVVDPRRRWPT